MSTPMSASIAATSTVSMPSATTVSPSEWARLTTEDDDRPVAGVVLHLRDELAVDLQLLHREVLQPGQRRVAGTEVVDGAGDAGVGRAAAARRVRPPRR